MSLRSKKQLLGLFLVAVTAWPLVQIALVLGYGVNPWKLAGWGMYSAPDLPEPSVRIERVSCAGPDAVQLHQLPRPVRQSIERFRRWRWTFGRLHEPDEVAREIALSSEPYRRLSIVVVETVFDYDTKMLGRVETAYGYEGACPAAVAPS